LEPNKTDKIFACTNLTQPVMTLSGQVTLY